MKKSDFKECPACAEWIRPRAGVCKFCGAILTRKKLPAFLPTGRLDGEGEMLDEVARQFARLKIPLSESHKRRVVEFLKRSGDDYRSATVLFTDLVGYTSLCQRLSPETVKELLQVYYSIFIQTVEFYNGFVIEFAGDGGLAVFGAPMAFDRDSEAAVRAALEIRARIRALPPQEGAVVKISAGLATGEILSSVIRTASPAQFKIYGPAVNLAARVEAAAEPDTVLIDPATHALVKGAFEFKEKPPRQFKNIKAPLATYVVLRDRKIGRSRTVASGPFAGREVECARLAELWEQFSRTASPRGAQPSAAAPNGVVISGEAGIGKSRLADEFARALPQPPRVIRAAASPYGAKIPWGLWRSFLSAAWGWEESPLQIPPEESLRRGLEQAGFAPAEQTALDVIFGLPRAVEKAASLSPGDLRRMILADLHRLIEALAAAGPIILSFDNLQWADASSLEALGTLAGEQRPAGAFFILMHRGGFALPSDAWAKLPSLALQPLGQEARRALFNMLLSARDFSPDVRDHLARRSEGNPFYLLEMIQALKDLQRERLQSRAPALTLKELTGQIPASLQQMLQARVDQLADHHKAVLQCAAILGPRFPLQTIEMFDHIRDDLLPNLYGLKSLGILDDAPLPGGLEFSFRQNLVCEIAYRGLTERRRQELHLAIAAKMEERLQAQQREYAPVLAHHFGRSSDKTRAVKYLEMAGVQAAQMAGTHEALSHFNKAIDQLRSLPPGQADRRQLADLLMNAGRLHRLSGDAKAALGVFADAGRLAAQSRDRRSQAVYRLERGLTHLQTNDYPGARKELKSARTLAQRLGDPLILGQATNGLGICDLSEGRFAKARAWLKKFEGLKLHRIRPGLAADAQNNLALLEWKQGRLKEAAAHFKKALQYRHRAGDRFGVALTLMNLAIMFELQGRYDEAERRYLESLEIGRQLRFAQLMTAVESNLANLDLNRRSFDSAAEHAERSLQIAGQIGDRRSAAIALENLAEAAIGMGRFAQARSHIERARQMARAINDQERLASLGLTLIQCRLDEGALRGVESGLRQSENRLTALNLQADRPRLLRLKALFLLKRRDTAAREALSTAAHEAQRQNNRAELRRLRELQAAAAPA